MRAASVDSYLALLRVGFTLPRTVTSRAVRSYRTFSPLPNLRLSKTLYSDCEDFTRDLAVYFLLH